MSAVPASAPATGGLRAQLVPVIDQPVASGSNFLLNSLVARASTTGSFAAFTVATTGYIVMQGAARGGLYLRLLARPDHGEHRDAIAVLLGLVVAGAAVVGLIAGAIFLAGHALAAALLCFFLPVILLQDGQRFAAFLRRRDTDALASDALWLVATVVLLLAWRAFGGALTPAVTTSLWLAGASTAVMLLIHRRYVPRAGGPVPAEHVAPRASAAGSLEFLAAASVTFGAPLLAAVAYGADGVAGLRASLVFFAPCLAFLPGVQTPVVRMLAHAGTDRRSIQFLCTIVLLCVVGPAVGLMFAFRGTIGPLLLGNLWPTMVALVAPAACFVVARFVELPAYGMARVVARPRSMLLLRVVTSVAIMTCFVTAMLLGASLVTSYWTLAAAAAACAVVAQLLPWGET